MGKGLVMVETQALPSSEAVTLGAQTSADDNRTTKHVLELRKLLARHCAGPYSAEIHRFALVLRIGGCMKEFDEGCGFVRRNRKEKHITADLGFPSNRWRHASDLEIRSFLAEAVETGLLCCLRRLEKDKAEVNAAALLQHFAHAKRAFVGEHRVREGGELA